VVKYGTDRLATYGNIIRRVRFACFIAKTADTHTFTRTHSHTHSHTHTLTLTHTHTHTQTHTHTHTHTHSHTHSHTLSHTLTHTDIWQYNTARALCVLYS
jgi:hypothetical protein